MSDKRTIKIISLGSDPEFFLRDVQSGKYISSLEYIKGSKKNPAPLKELGEGFSIQKDNVLIEFCVPPTNNADILYNNIKKAINYVTDNILPPNLEIVPASSATYDNDQLDNRYARIFGCDPSYNAWTLSPNMVEDNNSNVRGAGFHIHIGYEDPDPMVSAEFVRLLDLFVGVPSVLFDDDLVRRRQYGKAGEFRLTSYGLEYRSLGGYIMQSKDFFDAAIIGINKALMFYNDGKTLSDTNALDIQTAINSSSRGLAEKLVEQFQMQDIISKVLVLD